MQTVNYYDVLGVSPTADDFVIKAAYKALAQRYHPDKFHGNAKDAADAEAKMRQLNEAYQVLSDPAKRRDYDASFEQGEQQNQQNSQQKSEQAKQQEDWAIALRFYPDLTELEARLGKIDPSLISEFRSSLLASQQYEQRQGIASQLEQTYLEEYFGNDPLIVDFARELLLAGKRDGAKELNRMVKVVGGGVSSAKIIVQIEKSYLPGWSKERRQNDIGAFIRWDLYAKKYRINESDLARFIRLGAVKSKLINEEDLDGVVYVEDKDIKSNNFYFWVAAVFVLVLMLIGN